MSTHINMYGHFKGNMCLLSNNNSALEKKTYLCLKIILANYYIIPGFLFGNGLLQTHALLFTKAPMLALAFIEIFRSTMLIGIGYYHSGVLHVQLRK